MKHVILIGHNYNSILGIARALGPEGYVVDVIRTGVSTKDGFRSLGTMPEARSKYIHKYIAGRFDEKQIMHRLVTDFAESNCTNNKAVLFPVDDVCAEIVDSNLKLLQQYYFVPNVNNEQGGVIRLMDKFYMKQLAKSVGLPVPEGWSIQIENGRYDIPEDLPYPCFAKPEMPFVNRKAFMGRCNNETELKKLLDSVSNSRRNCLMIIEEYIPIEREYGSVGYADGLHVCIPAITEKTVLGHGSNAGVTACGLIHLPDEFPELTSKLKLLMKKTQLNGLFDIDLYLSKGTIYFNELNVRMGAEGVGTLIAGVNLAAMCAEGLSNPENNIDFEATAREITFANEKPLIADFGEGAISWKEYRKYLRDADARFLKSNEDKKPNLDFSLLVMRQVVKKYLKRRS